MRRPAVSLLALVAFAGSACAAADDRGMRGPPPASTAPPAVAVAEARLVERACDTSPDLPPTDCYWLEVPERRDAPGARTIRLWVAVVQGQGTAASQLPLLDLTGGPGDTASSVWVDGEVTFVGDGNPTLIVVDQRGTGRSQPRLACPEVDALEATTTSDADQVAAHRRAITACRDRLVADGADLEGYDSVESARDLVDLRTALGFPQAIVRGFSYGGRLAAELYRQDPDGVAGLLLDSTLSTGPWTLRAVVDNANEAVTGLDTACNTRPSCAVHGSVAANLERAAVALDAEPLALPSGRVLDGSTLRFGVVQAMYDEDLIPAIPGLLAAVAAGDRDVLRAVATGLEPPTQSDVDSLAAATFGVVSCADEASAAVEEDRVVLEESGPWLRLALAHAQHCDVWDVEPAVVGGLVPAAGDVPVLAFVGGLDPVHPRSFTDETTSGLRNTTVVVVPAGAHGSSFTNPCTQSISLAFLADPDAPIDTSCVESLPAPFETRVP